MVRDEDQIKPFVRSPEIRTKPCDTHSGTHSLDVEAAKNDTWVQLTQDALERHRGRHVDEIGWQVVRGQRIDVYD